MYDAMSNLIAQGIPQLLILMLGWCSVLVVGVRAVLRLLLAQEVIGAAERPERPARKAA